MRTNSGYTRQRSSNTIQRDPSGGSTRTQGPHTRARVTRSPWCKYIVVVHIYHGYRYTCVQYGLVLVSAVSWAKPSQLAGSSGDLNYRFSSGDLARGSFISLSLSLLFCISRLMIRAYISSSFARMSPLRDLHLG